MQSTVQLGSLAIAVPSVAMGAIALGISVNNTQEINKIKNQRGGSVSGPPTSTLHAIATFANENGNLLSNNILTLSPDGVLFQIQSNVGIDMSVADTINLLANNLLYNGHPLITSISNTITDGNIATYVNTKQIHDSGINIASLALQTDLSQYVKIDGSSTMTGPLQLGLHSVTNGTSFVDMSTADTINLVATNVFVNGNPLPSSSAFLLTSGGNSMLGNLNMGGNSLINVPNVLLTSGINAMVADFPLGLHNITNGTSLINMTTANTINLETTNLEWNGVLLATVSDLNNYVLLSGGSVMTGNLQIGLHNITNGTSIINMTTSNTINFITTNLEWNGVLLATISDLNNYVLLSGASVMTGNLQLGLHSLTNGTSSINMSVANTIDLIATNVLVNGNPIGNVSGPNSSTNNAIVTFNGTSGKIVQDSNLLFSANVLSCNSNSLDFSSPGIISISSILSLSQTTNFNAQLLNNTGSLLPNTDNTYDIGQTTLTYRDLYLSGNLHNTQQSIWDSDNNQAYPIAPAGQRDKWQQTTFSGSYLVSWNNIVYAYDNVLTSTLYSTDGGVTYSTVIFNIAPTSSQAIGWNGSSLWVSISTSDPSDQVYTSSDGIHFTAQGVGGFNIVSYNIVFAFNLFIANSSSGNTTGVITSSNGITWTAQTTPNVGGVIFRNSLVYSADFGIVVSAMGSNSNTLLWSTNGTSWTAGTVVGVMACAVTYNSDRRQFLATHSPNGRVQVSSDGKTWTNLGNAIAPANMLNVIWVSKYNRYYTTSVTNNLTLEYDLYQTNDPSIVWQKSTLDMGGIGDIQNNTLLYLPSLDRFLIGTSTFTAYSTPRPYDIQAVSNNIRVLGMPVNTSKYSTITTVTVNTTTETSISNPSSSIGSLRFPPNQPNGSIMRFGLNMTVTSSAGDTLTIRYYSATNLIIAFPITVPSSSSNLPILLDTQFTVLGTTNLFITHTLSISGLSSTIVNTTSSAYDTTQFNVLSVTAQWSANVNQLTMNQFLLNTFFQNGS